MDDFAQGDSHSVLSTMGAKVKLKKSLNVLGAMSIIIGSIIGSGIFISPKGILLYTGSIGLNLVIWVACGLIATGGALCFVELATVVKMSGGEWAYIKEGLGPAPAFLAGWMNTVLISTSTAAICLSSGNYLLSSFYGCGGIPTVTSRLTGILLTWCALYINSSVKLATRVLKILLILKVLAMVLIIVGGFYWFAVEGTEKLNDSFQGTTQDGWKIALAFYSGLWAYEGWNCANFVTEEVKSVRYTMPRAIIGSTVLVTVLYLLVNISYYAVLTSQEVLDSSAVAVDWADRVVGRWSGSVGIIVSFSMFGSALAGLFSSSRVLMAVAREGHTLELLSMVSVKDGSPLISLYVRVFLCTIFCAVGDIGDLINFFSFSAWLFYAMSFTSLLVLRYKRRNEPKNKDIFQVPIVLPILMILVAVYLIVVPIIADPQLPYLYATIFMFSGLILYFPFVMCKVKWRWFDNVTLFFQLLCKVGVPDKDI